MCDATKLYELGMMSQFYSERFLPFGLRSSPYIFNQVTEAVEWILRHKFAIPDLNHYLDDFLNVSSGSSHLAHLQLSIVLQVCHYLGIPLAPEKIEGPTHCLKFLDCLAMEARLPDDTLTELCQLLTNHLDQPSVTKGELATLLGKLSFAARVVIPGRTFTRRLWDLKTKYHSSKLHPHSAPSS